MIKRGLKDIDSIIIHCSDSDYSHHDDISVIKKWHIERGFDDIGYHYFIKKNGDIQLGRSIWFVGAHCSGCNRKSIGICLHGAKSFNDAQFTAAAKLIKNLAEILPMMIRQKNMPVIFAHRFFNKDKTCPNFEINEITKRFPKNIIGVDRVKMVNLFTP